MLPFASATAWESSEFPAIERIDHFTVTDQIFIQIFQFILKIKSKSKSLHLQLFCMPKIEF